MKRFFDWQVILGLVLIFLTAFFYLVHYFVFRDVHHIFIYFIGDVAFVFFEVLLVTLVIHRLLHHREKERLSKKINMLTGAFFSEVGTELLRQLAIFEGDAGRINWRLAVPDDWSEREFLDIRESILRAGPEIYSRKGDLEAVRRLLSGKKQFLLDLLLNPALPEEESFTNLVWAVFHLAEELGHRDDLQNLEDGDARHLEEDVARVYHLLVLSWMDFVQHLKEGYPFLYSLAARTNPFDEKVSVAKPA